jgi:CO dehydrogenase/acetyl-CoA synthase alpha subunit
MREESEQDINDKLHTWGLTGKGNDKDQSIKLEGFDIELQSLPTVAASLAVLSMTLEDQEVKNIIRKSREYLNLLLDNAIEKNVKTV